MKIFGNLDSVEDSGCYTLLEMRVGSVPVKLAINTYEYSRPIMSGCKEGVNIYVDSVSEFEVSLLGAGCDGFIEQPKGAVSLHAKGEVIKVLDLDEVVVRIPGFGDIEVKFEFDVNLEVGNMLEFRGCLSGELCDG